MWKYLSLIGLSTWKFLFAPLAGMAGGLDFWETLVCSLIGAYLSATVIYFGSSLFLKKSVKQKGKKEITDKQANDRVKKKKRFTKKNRWIIRVKQRLGRYFVYWAFPLFLSIPIGTMIVSKFYRHHKETYFYIMVFLTVSGFVITSLVFLF
ncbi:MAG: hypothetical protein H3C31_05435 [Brumimicrobium sp.]|nr:hypothetical protein [Brumimicrobium sp.]